jgi:hypothetical protein
MSSTPRDRPIRGIARNMAEMALLLPHLLVSLGLDRKLDNVLTTPSTCSAKTGDYLRARSILQCGTAAIRTSPHPQQNSSSPDCPTKLAIINDYATALIEIGENAHARDHNEDTLVCRTRILGPDHAETLESWDRHLKFHED